MNAILEKVAISPVNMEERRRINISAGDTVRVWQKIEEKGKTRLQAFEGTVLARKHGNEPGGTFTVRRVTGGIGVEKIFPLYSPMIDRIEIVRRVKTRRSKLYYIREKAAREIKRQMRRMRLVSESTTSDMEEQAAKAAADTADANTDTADVATKDTETPVVANENTPKEETPNEEIAN